MFNFGKNDPQNQNSTSVDDTVKDSSNNSNTDQTPSDNNAQAFDDQPLNQIVTDPQSWQNITRWKCGKCKFQYEGTSNPEKCPNCGAGREFFMEIG